MKVVRIGTSNGIDDIKLIAEDDAEAVFIKQLTEAGTLTSLNKNASSSAVFRAISVNPAALSSQLISSGNIGKYDFSVRQNQNHTIGLTFVKNTAPMNLSVYSAIKLQVKPSKHSSAIISLQIGDGLTLSGAESNVLNIALSAAQTKELCNETYYYDILFVGASSNVYYVEGKITVKKSGTR